MSKRTFIVKVNIPDRDNEYWEEEDLEAFLQDMLDSKCEGECLWEANVKEVRNDIE